MSLTSKEVLDAALSTGHDTTPTMRSKALVWLNEAIQKLAVERDWAFMSTSADLTPTSNAITLPDAFNRFVSAQGSTSGYEFFLTEKNRLTDEEAYRLTDDTATNPIPMRYTEVH